MELCRFKTTWDKLDTLKQMYDQVLEFEVLKEDELLLEHAHAMRHRLKLALVKDQHNYLFGLNSVEAVAYRKTWELVNDNMTFGRYPAELIRSTIEVVDRYIGQQNVKKIGKGLQIAKRHG